MRFVYHPEDSPPLVDSLFKNTRFTGFALQIRQIPTSTHWLMLFKTYNIGP